jgi:maltose O-acetyltransferase
VVQVEGVLRVGDGLVIRSRAHNRVDIAVALGAELQLGDDVFINQGVRIACASDIRIGNRCQIGDESVLLDSDYHGIGSAAVKTGAVVLEDGAWLATRVVVLRGVTIGAGSIIGAGSVVTHSIPSFCFAAGVPARVIHPVQERLSP